MSVKRIHEDGTVLHQMDARLPEEVIRAGKRKKGYRMQRDWYAAAIREYADNPEPALAVPSTCQRKVFWIPEAADLAMVELARKFGADRREIFYTASLRKYEKEKSPPGDGESS